MRKLVILSAVFFCGIRTANADNLVLIDFATDSYDSTLSWLGKLEAQGVTARHIFAPNIAIVNAHGLPETFLKTGAANCTTPVLHGISAAPSILSLPTL